MSTLTATSTATAANFVASSASATSTFAGGLAIETSGFVYDFSSNKVGIGMSNPTETLHVTGTGRFSGALTLDTALTVANGGTGQTSLSSSQLLYGAGTSAVKSVATTTLSLGTGLSYSGTLGSLVGGASGTLSLSGVAPSSLSLTKGNFIVGDDAGTAQATSTIFISSMGKVGIGTTSPSYRLDVDGTARTSDLITSSIVLTSSSTAYSTLTSYGGFNGYIKASGGFGTGGSDSVLNAERITAYGNLVNIGSIQAGEINLTSAGTFATKVDYATNAVPVSIATGDLNGDGKDDLVVTNLSNTASVLINNGNGTFATKVDYATGVDPFGVAIGDLNGDGKADLAVANYTASTASVLINNGNGTFATKVDYTTGAGSDGIAIGDLNGDGKADLAVANYTASTASVLINNGNGTFATKVDYTTGAGPFGVAIGDLNGDGKADFAVANFDTTLASVLINNGNGTFATKVDYTTGAAPGSIAIGDLNGDGKADLAVTNNGVNSASVFINNGNGTFATKVDYTTGAGPRGIAIGDLNGDGKADFAVGNNGATSASVFINNGNDTFATKVDYTTGAGPYSIATGDLNGDGKADLAVANRTSSTASVLLNTSNTMFFAKASTGRVGIGTTTPYSKLTVWGEDTIANIMANFVNSASTSVMSILNNGNIGIGSTSPAYLLSMEASGGGFYDASTNAFTTGPSFSWLKQDRSVLSRSDTFDILNNTNIEKFKFIEEVNELGVGADTHIGIILDEAHDMLSTHKDGAITGYNPMRTASVAFRGVQLLTQAIDIISAPTSTPSLFIDTNGNIGVGTTSPEYKIHVIGDIAATSFVNISTAESKKDIEHISEEKKKQYLKNWKMSQSRSIVINMKMSPRLYDLV